MSWPSGYLDVFGASFVILSPFFIFVQSCVLLLGPAALLACIEYIKEQQLYRFLVPSSHILLTFCIRIGTFDRSRVSGLVQVFRVSCIVVTRVRVQRANMDH